MQSSTSFLSDLTIISPLGRGSGSFVYKVSSRKSSSQYVRDNFGLTIKFLSWGLKALKVIDKKQKNFASLYPKVLNEISIHSKLKHDNIISFLGSCEDDDNIYILLELCEGGELYHFIKKTTLSLETTKSLAKQIATALKYLHGLKIIHRDLKLGNILLTKDQRIAQTLQETLQNIKSGQFSLPDSMDLSLKELLSNILTIDSSERFSIEEILSHEFFREPRRIKYQRNFELKNTKGLMSTRNIKEEFKLSSLGMLSCRGKENENLNKESFGYTGKIKETRRRTNTVHAGGQIQPKNEEKDKASAFVNFYRINPRNDSGLKEITLGKSELQEPYEAKRTRACSIYKSQLSPLKSIDLEPCSFNLKRCSFEILKDFSVRLVITGKNIEFKISANGDTVEINNRENKKKYSLENLPPKYHKFYMYGKKITEKMRSKTPRIVINNEDGQFYLMKNDPKPNFEAFLSNGYTIYLRAWDEDFKIIKDDLAITRENFWLYGKDKEIKESLRKAFNYLKSCLRKI